MPFNTLTRLSFAKCSTSCTIDSHPLSVMSNSALHAPFNSAVTLMFSSCSFPHSPVCFLTSSNDVDMVSNCSMSLIPASAP